jgi:hypothetical protein
MEPRVGVRNTPDASAAIVRSNQAFHLTPAIGRRRSTSVRYGPLSLYLFTRNERLMTDPKLTEAEKRRIADALQRKGVIRGCPMCGHNSWVLADGYFNQTLQTKLSGLVIGGASVPTAVVVCTNCGFVSQHALGVLGMLPGVHGGAK